MRLASSISPSRVSSGTVPISRRYMRTGSLVLSPDPGEFQFGEFFAFFELLVELELRLLENLDAGGVQFGQQIVEFAPHRELFGQHLVDFVVEDVALLLAGSISCFKRPYFSSVATATPDPSSLYHATNHASP